MFSRDNTTVVLPRPLAIPFTSRISDAIGKARVLYLPQTTVRKDNAVAASWVHMLGRIQPRSRHSHVPLPVSKASRQSTSPHWTFVERRNADRDRAEPAPRQYIRPLWWSWCHCCCPISEVQPNWNPSPPFAHLTQRKDHRRSCGGRCYDDLLSELPEIEAKFLAFPALLWYGDFR